MNKWLIRMNDKITIQWDRESDIHGRLVIVKDLDFCIDFMIKSMLKFVFQANYHIVKVNAFYFTF